MLNLSGTFGSKAKPWPKPLLQEDLENRLWPPKCTESVRKHLLLLGTLLAMFMPLLLPPAHADLYVGSFNTDSILRYDEVTGAFIDAFVPSGSGGLHSPRSLLIGPDGNLYVGSAIPNSDTNSVMRYAGTTGAPLPAPGQLGAVFASGGDLLGTQGVILGRDGNLYVVSHRNASVLRYSGTTGQFLDTFVPTGSGGLSAPWGMVFGPDGNLYVNSDGPVLRYDGVTGAPLPAPGQTGATFVAGWSQAGPTMVFGPDCNLYLSDFTKNSIVRFNGVTGEFMGIFVSPSSGGLDAPAGLVFGPDNNLYVSSAYNNRVLRYDGATGGFIDDFIPSGSGGLVYPLFLVFTNTDPTTLAYVSPSRSRFLITAPATVVSGTPLDLTVTALGASGNIDANYLGTVTFATTDQDGGVVLPADYTFTTGDGGDNGVHTFPGGVTLVTMGDQTLTVTDNVGGITGSMIITVGPGP